MEAKGLLKFLILSKDLNFVQIMIFMNFLSSVSVQTYMGIIYHFKFVFIKRVIHGIVESFHCTVFWFLFKRDTDMRLARISFQADGRLLWFPAWMTHIEVIALQRYIQSTITVLDYDLYPVFRHTHVWMDLCNGNILLTFRSLTLTPDYEQQVRVSDECSPDALLWY